MVITGNYQDKTIGKRVRIYILAVFMKIMNLTSKTVENHEVVTDEHCKSASRGDERISWWDVIRSC